MASRAGAPGTPAPPARPALVVSLLILLALALLAPASAVSAKSPRAASSHPTTPAPAPTAVEAPVPAAPAPPARHVRTDSRPAAGSDAPAVSVPGATQPTVTSSASGRQARRERHAQRLAERQAATEAGEEPTAAVAPNAAASGKNKERREHEREQRELREQRRREREQQRQEGHHETRKQREAREGREAREAREAEEAAEGLSVVPSATSLAVATTASVTPVPLITDTTSAPSIASERREAASGGDATRSSRAARTRRHAASAAATDRAAAAPALLSTPAALRTGVRRHDPPRAPRPARAAHRASPLVRTVTQIIGVIPAWLWAVLAGLGALSIALAASSRVSARRAARLARQRQALLEDVGLLQAALLPELPERLGPVATSVSYRPASGPGAGGDFYDVFALEHGLVATILGDVSGHGREALPHTTLLRFTLRTYLEAGLSPRETLRAAAPGLERQLGGSFATVVVATYDPRERRLTYACAGHPHPIVTGLAHDATVITCSAPPIGAGNPTGTRQTSVAIPGAARVCMYTDGVIEARVEGELYGPRRFAAALDALDATVSADELLDRVAEETDRRPDDMAACVLGIDGAAIAPVVRTEELVLDGRDAERARTRRFLRAVGVPEPEIERVLRHAKAVAADHASALVKIHLGDGPPQVTVTHDNLAPLRARAIARTQEVVL